MDAISEYRKCGCLHCGEHIEFPVSGIGKHVQCPHCHKLTRLFSDPKLFSGSHGPIRVEAGARDSSSAEDSEYDRIVSEVPNKPDFVQGLCERCSQALEFPREGLGTRIRCPACGRNTALYSPEFMAFVQRYLEAKAKEAQTAYGESLRKITCPNCGSEFDYYVCQPGKPMVFTPMSFTGILAGGIANAMADRIFPSEKVCRNCGHHWPDEL
jgi:predicted RNA-binding Zn-ribbon protein involved in translation (DUF1610 family)